MVRGGSDVVSNWRDGVAFSFGSEAELIRSRSRNAARYNREAKRAAHRKVRTVARRALRTLIEEEESGGHSPEAATPHPLRKKMFVSARRGHLVS